jgi:hypothetical protein
MSGSAAVSAAKNRRGGGGKQTVAPPGQTQQGQSQPQLGQHPQQGNNVQINPLQILHNHEMRLIASEKQQKEILKQLNEMNDCEITPAVQSENTANFMPIITLHESKISDLATKLVLLEKQGGKQGSSCSCSPLTINDLLSRFQSLETQVSTSSSKQPQPINDTAVEETLAFYKARTSQLETLVADLKETLFKLQTFAIQTNTDLNNLKLKSKSDSIPSAQFGFQEHMMNQLSQMCSSRQYVDRQYVEVEDVDVDVEDESRYEIKNERLRCEFGEDIELSTDDIICTSTE